MWGKERVGVVIMKNHSFNIKLGTEDILDIKINKV